VQGAAVLAIVGLYWPRLVQMTRGLLGRDPVGLRLFWHVALACAPAFALWPFLVGAAKEHLFAPTPVLLALVVGGLWMIALDRRRARRGLARDEGAGIEDLTWKQALGIGLFQFGAIWPGTSRAMMTIAGGTVLGLRPAQAAEFSFLLGLPTIAAATAYELKQELSGDGPGMVEVLGAWPIALGSIVALVSAALTVHWMVGFLDRRGLAPFGWYRIALAALLLALTAAGLPVLGQG
jgi:undecaprenyl-diphosphatase